MMTNDYLMAALGGTLFGLASVVLLWFNGRIAGISGITYGMFSRTLSEVGWRVAFVVGLIGGGALFQVATGTPLMERSDFPLWMTLVAGLLVGFGTRLGSGCTSGHGICGLSRLSIRSLVATLTFMLVGVAVATLLTGVLR